MFTGGSNRAWRQAEMTRLVEAGLSMGLIIVGLDGPSQVRRCGSCGDSWWW